jgi:micrococcal nuclease
VYHYRARITRVVDGDTFDAIVDVGFSIHIAHRFRVNNFDAPELWRPKTEAERTHGQLAKAKAIELLEGQTVEMTTYKLDIYARYAADITLSDGSDYATVMRESGFEKMIMY